MGKPIATALTNAMTNFFKTASPGAHPHRMLKVGERVSLLQADPIQSSTAHGDFSFYRIQDEDGVEGYILEPYLEQVEPVGK